MEIKKHNIVVIAVSCVISAGIFINALSRRPGKTAMNLTSKTFRTPAGWGYDVLANDTVIIHQETIPCIAGHTGFAEKEEAAKTAALVINKMQRGQLPTVTISEQQKICPLLGHDKP